MWFGDLVDRKQVLLDSKVSKVLDIFPMILVKNLNFFSLLLCKLGPKMSFADLLDGKQAF